MIALAARLESAAQPGTVLISHETLRQVRGAFDYRPVAPIAARGFDRPVAAYQVLHRRAARLPRAVAGVTAPLIGRQAELDALRQAYEQMRTTGTLRSATVAGVAGIGKSRLLAEFESWAADQPRHSAFSMPMDGRRRAPYPTGCCARCWQTISACSRMIRRTKHRRFRNAFLAASGLDADNATHAHFVGYLLGNRPSTPTSAARRRKIPS